MVDNYSDFNISINFVVNSAIEVMEGEYLIRCFSER